ncbi:TonB-dependent outer membrane receptor, partial [Escherichia coli]|nr:TonB-dependent outer membrane receptor [Escherichia coli]
EQLCRSPRTRPGTYRAVLQLWIGRFGEVRHSRLLGSTGDPQRDSALVES